MLKKQISKILVFLLMLGILYGCKRHLLDPLNPQTQLPPKVKLDKVKGFYENGRYKNQPKRTSSNGNERMTAQDSARFKDFEPQWNKTVVELLPNNEKMLIVPVVRFLRVDYNENIGFIRRLCIRVDANDDFLEANIVELIGNLTFVKANHNAIFKNYKENNITGFEGVIATYGLNYDKISTKEFDNGIGNTCANCLIMVVVGDCIIVTDNGGNVILEVCGDGGSSGGGSSGGGGSGSGGSGAGGGNSPPGCPCGVASCPPCPVIAVPSNTGGTSSPPYVNPTYTPPVPIYTPIYDPSGTGTDTGSGGTYNPPPQPPKGYQIPLVVIPTVPSLPTTPITSNTPMPFPGMVLDYEGVWVYPIDNGCTVCDVYTYDANGNIIENIIDDIYDEQNSTLTPKQKTALNLLFNSLKRKSCLFGEMIAKMKQAGVKIKFSNNPNMSVGAAFNYEDNAIIMNNVSEIALLEELVHAFQFSQDPAGFEAISNININPSQTGVSNIEFEAKLLMNLMSNMSYQNGGDTIIGDFEFAISGGVNATNSNVTKRYRTWLKNITANYTKFPTSFTPSQLSSYYGFLQNFRQANFGDMNVIGYFSPANNTKPPTSLFSLTQNSNCKN